MRDRMHLLGWLVSLDIDHSRVAIEGDNNDATSLAICLGVGPELRHHSRTEGRILPFGFLGGRVGVDWRRQESEPVDSEYDWTAALGARAGLGAEFFPVRHVGLNAQIGIGADVRYSPLEFGGTDGHRLDLGLGTFTASLGRAFYF